MSSTRISRIKTLQKRLNCLETRIKKSDKDLTYDKAEASALKWAIEELSKLYVNKFATSSYLGLTEQEIEHSEPYSEPSHDSEG